MKEWFKYKYGFVNIDKNFVFLTKSGNWSETSELKEKNYKGFKTSELKDKIKIFSYLAVLALLAIWLMLKNLASGDLSFLLLIGLPVLFYFVYHYLIREANASFLIPKDKIFQIEIVDEETTLFFYDINGKETSHIIKEFDQKGFEILQKLKSTTLK